MTACSGMGWPNDTVVAFKMPPHSGHAGSGSPLSTRACTVCRSKRAWQPRQATDCALPCNSTIAWSGNPAGQLPSWAAKAQNSAPDKLYIPPVSPGCDDSAARATTCVQDRAGGGYYQATWDGAFASNPSWAVTVSTFNEWLESTQIEPSVQYGDQYLQITRQNANAFHSGSAATSSDGPS